MRRISTLLVATVALAVFAAVAAAAAPPTGNRAAIAFYRQVAAAYTHVGTVSLARTGYLSYVAAGGTFRFQFGMPPPAGFRPARESIVAVLRDGRTVTYVDTARAAGLPTLTIIGDGTGIWARLGGERCFYRNARTSDVFGVDAPFVGVYGNFLSIQRLGATVAIRSTFPWDGGSAAETDHFSAATKLWRSVAVHVSGSHSGLTGWSMSGFRERSAAPASLESPEPHCA